MDIDFKFIGNSLSDNELKSIFVDICSCKEDDNISFKVISVDDIASETKYGGKTVRLEARFFNIRKRFGVDIGIGDVVTPFPIEYDYELSFRNEECKLLAYTIESMMAEKFETLISKGTQNSRSKDLFDLYLLGHRNYSKDNLNVAMVNTFNLRGTEYSKNKIFKALGEVFEFERTRVLYENYARKNNFAKNITFDMCKKAIYKIYENLHFNTQINLSDYGIELTLVRHGGCNHDKVGGWSDIHLDDNGKEEIKSLLPKIGEYDLFASSDLNRAKETSNIINAKLRMEIVYDENYREMNNGDLKDLAIDDFSNFNVDYKFSSLRMDQKYPGGESPNEFYERVRNGFMSLLEHNKKKNTPFHTCKSHHGHTMSSQRL